MKLGLVQFSSNFGGSTISGQMIADGLLAKGWEIDAYFAFDGPFVSSAKKDGCVTTVISHNNWLRSAGLLRFMRNLSAEKRAAAEFERAFSQARPDLIYVNSLVSFAPARAAFRLGIPLIWHIRELFSDAHGEMVWPSWPGRVFARQAIERMPRRIVVNSRAVKDNVLGESCEDKVVEVPNAVDRKFFSPRGDALACRQALGLPEKGPVIGVPGTLRPVKGHGYFFQSIPAILSRLPDSHFLVTGAIDSEYARDLVQRIQSETFADRVHFTGAVDEMLSIYHASDLCCIPSQSESFGRAAIECFATQTPVIATSVGGLREIVRHGENGYSVEYGDVEGIAEGVEAIYRNPELSDRLVTQGAHDAAAAYTEERYVERVARVIDETLAQG